MPQVSEKTWRKYMALRADGVAYTRAAQEAGISINTARKFEKGDPTSSGIVLKNALHRVLKDRPLAHHELSDDAADCLEDFERFRARYFGHWSVPWQADAGHRIAELCKTDDRSYVVVNVAPGSGKSTLFSHDLVCWLICRDRAIRALSGSYTQRLADTYVKRVRNTLDRPSDRPFRASSRDKEQGKAFDAVATLTGDYGRFHPTPAEGGSWRGNEFTVAQVDGTILQDKEQTLAAFGFDSGYLGLRFEFAIWDDLVTERNTRNPELREQLFQTYEDIAESRLEPGGCLVLQGQRLGADDLYRHVLDMTSGAVEEIDGTGVAVPPPKYHHVVYKAHDEQNCHGDHAVTARPWPEGCLLDPKRLPWSLLRAQEANRRERYRVVYQQEDVDASAALVDPRWIEGGIDPASRVDYPGCWDTDRDLCALPHNFADTIWSFVTVDPSPARYWGIIWWCYAEQTEQWFVMDLLREPMTASDFLDVTPEGLFTGVMERWQTRSADLGWPITAWIVEKNAAQRFLLQYNHSKNWAYHHQVEVIPHETNANKSDPEYGVQSLAPLFRYGKVRLPGYSLEARNKMDPYVKELTRYPDGATNDLVMSTWFGVWNKNAVVGTRNNGARLWRPSWMRDDAGRYNRRGAA